MIYYHASHEQFPPRLLPAGKNVPPSTAGQSLAEWKNNIFDSSLLAQLRLPSEFEAAGMWVRPEDMREHVRISPNLEQHLEWIRKDIEMGFTDITLHNVNREQERFIQEFGRKAAQF